MSRLHTASQAQVARQELNYYVARAKGVGLQPAATTLHPGAAVPQSWPDATATATTATRPILVTGLSLKVSIWTSLDPRLKNLADQIVPTRKYIPFRFAPHATYEYSCIWKGRLSQLLRC